VKTPSEERKDEIDALVSELRGDGTEFSRLGADKIILLEAKLANAENEIPDLILVNDEIFETDHHTIGMLVWCCIACCLIFFAVGVVLGKWVL
jgi:hypothetical protein